jgi:pimeloyl-ACP methyl ester carboxylesterase
VPDVLDHVLISGAATRSAAIFAGMNAMMGVLSPNQLADLIFLQSHIPKPYHHLVLEGVRTVKPAAFRHFSYELAKIELPQKVLVPLLISVGQQESFVAQQSAREMSRSIQNAKGVMAPGMGHFWSLEAPDLFTQAVRSWVTNRALPQAFMAF